MRVSFQRKGMNDSGHRRTFRNRNARSKLRDRANRPLAGRRNGRADLVADFAFNAAADQRGRKHRQGQQHHQRTHNDLLARRAD